MPSPYFLVDTNILIRWSHHQSPDFRAVGTAIHRLSDQGGVPCYTSQNLGEFWNVLTRPSDRNGYGLSPAIADIRASDIESAFHLLQDSPAVHAVWRRMLVDQRISGVQVHDARIAASMLVHGISRILSFNHRDFARFPGIEALHPEQLSEPDQSL
jgi:predicted nucleic acid-binding protein